MNKIVSFPRGNWITLLSVTLLTLIVASAWHTLKTPLDPSIRAEYAYIEGEPDYKDVIGFRADRYDWHPYDFPVPPKVPKGTTTVYISFEIRHGSSAITSFSQRQIRTPMFTRTTISSTHTAIGRRCSTRAGVRFTMCTLTAISRANA